MNIKLELQDFFLARSGLTLGGQLNLFRNNIFIYIWLFLSTFQTVWRFSVPRFCLRIPLPSWPRASWNLGLFSQQCSPSLLTHRGPYLCLRHTSLCLGSWFISWVKSCSGFSVTGKQAAGNTTNMAVMIPHNIAESLQEELSLEKE